MGITCDSSKLFTFHGTEWIKFWLWNKSCSRGCENQRTASIIQQPLLVQWRKHLFFNDLCSVNVMLLYGLTSLWTNSLVFCEHAYIYCIFARLFFPVRDIQVQMFAGEDQSKKCRNDFRFNGEKLCGFVRGGPWFSWFSNVPQTELQQITWNRQEWHYRNRGDWQAKH